MYYVYVIQNQRGKMYIGQTDNLAKRLLRHNGKLRSKMRSYTSINKGEWRVVYKEEYSLRTEALRREKEIKSHQGRDWLQCQLMGR